MSIKKSNVRCVLDYDYDEEKETWDLSVYSEPYQGRNNGLDHTFLMQNLKTEADAEHSFFVLLEKIIYTMNELTAKIRKQEKQKIPKRKRTKKDKVIKRPDLSEKARKRWADPEFRKRIKGKVGRPRKEQ